MEKGDDRDRDGKVNLLFSFFPGSSCCFSYY